jgi:negative regulator of sigma E activity
MALLAAALLAMLATGGPGGPGQRHAQEIVAAAWSSAQSAPYQAKGATGVEFCGTWLESRIRVYNDGRRELLEYLTGAAAGTRIYRDGAQRYQQMPQGKVVTYASDGQTVPASAVEMRLVARNYRFALHHPSHIAGRRVQVVTMIARDTNRRVRRLWIDAERSVVLATTQYDVRGHPVAWSRYSSISFRPHLDVAALAGALKGRAVEDGLPAKARARLGFSPAEPGCLPAGYRPVGPSAVVNCPCGCSGVSAVRCYSDGIRSFSLFQTDLRTHHCSGTADVCRHGRRCGHGCRATQYGPGSTVARQKGSLMVIAVGDLSVAQLQRVVESL